MTGSKNIKVRLGKNKHRLTWFTPESIYRNREGS